MKILINHPKCAQHVRNAVTALKKHDMLHSFTTSLNIETNKFPFTILPKKIRNFLNHRNFSNITKKINSSSLFMEFLRLLTSRRNSLNYVDRLLKETDIYNAKFLNNNKDKIDAVYAYEDSALFTFNVAKKNKIKCIYDLPACYWKLKKKIYDIEKKNNPHLPFQDHNDPIDKLKNKDKELQMADLIIVPSKFVKDSLKLAPIKNKKIIVIPFGAPPLIQSNKKWFNGKKKLKLLYVGGLTQRKGLSYLIKAIKEIDKKKICSTFIGRGPLENYIKKELPDSNLKVNTFSHKSILNEMVNNDILILPSLSEGFALVTLEAMSRGMVVICTNRCGLKDIGNKNDYIIVTPNNYLIIKKKINFFLKNPNALKRMGIRALKTAKIYNWHKYQDQLTYMINKNL